VAATIQRLTRAIARFMNPNTGSAETALLPKEKRAAWSLSLIYIVRMLGLFIILPVSAIGLPNTVRDAQ